MYDMDVSDCIDKISREACKCTHRADLPVQDTFLLSVLIVSLEDKRHIKNTALNHSIPFGLNIQR